MALTKEQIEAFVAEYRALCEKHGLWLVYDGGYRPSEIESLPEDPDWDHYREPYT